MSDPRSSRERVLAACRGEPVEAPPFWMMRQAGRYLPEYRALRSRHGFLDMVRAPELAAELTCQPLERFDMDCAVIFCDILIPPDAMGQKLSFSEGVGPILDPPLRDAEGVGRLSDFDAAKSCGFLGDAIRLVRKRLGEEKAIVGFCGAPFTTASYMIEGRSSRNFENTRAMMLGEPALFAKLLARIVDNLMGYLRIQVEAGADVLQIFDSWGGALDAATYRAQILPELTRLVQGAKELGVPVIVYANGGGHLLEALVETGCDVLSVDWRLAPEEILRRVGGRVALQGNLDPTTLFAPPAVVRRETHRVLDAFAPARGYIFNLGSGILPKTPVPSVEALFETLRARRGTS